MWRLFDTELNSESGARGRVEEIWTDEEILFRKPQDRYLFGITVIRRSKEASADDTGTGRGRFDLHVEQMTKQEGVTEQLKAQDQMLWVKRINNIRERAGEIVREEIIYCL